MPTAPLAQGDLWLKENGGAVAGGTDAAYCGVPRKPVPEPSTEEDYWLAPDLPGIRPDFDTGDPYDPRPSTVAEESRWHSHDHSPEHQDEPDEEGGSREFGGWVSEKAAEGSNEALPDRPVRGDRRKEDRDETSAQEKADDEPVASEYRVSRPSDGEGSPETKTRKKTCFFLPSSSRFRPNLDLREAYTSILEDSSRKTKTKEDRDDEDLGKNRDRRDAGTPNELKKKQKKPSNPPKRTEPKEDRRYAPKTNTASGRPVGSDKDVSNTPIFKKDPEPLGAGKTPHGRPRPPGVTNTPKTNNTEPARRSECSPREHLVEADPAK